jgi:hypothetical protein
MKWLAAAVRGPKLVDALKTTQATAINLIDAQLR